MAISKTHLTELTKKLDHIWHDRFNLPKIYAASGTYVEAGYFFDKREAKKLVDIINKETQYKAEMEKDQPINKSQIIDKSRYIVGIRKQV